MITARQRAGVFATLLLGYASFYLCRSNVDAAFPFLRASAAMPAVESPTTNRLETTPNRADVERWIRKEQRARIEPIFQVLGRRHRHQGHLWNLDDRGSGDDLGARCRCCRRGYR